LYCSLFSRSSLPYIHLPGGTSVITSSIDGQTANEMSLFPDRDGIDLDYTELCTKDKKQK
jgi:hypothetical protein